MPWIALTVAAPAAQAEGLSDILLTLGALSVDILDADADTAGEQAIFGEPGEIPPGLWSHNRITALFPENAPIDAIMASATHALGQETPLDYGIKILADTDWVRLTQEQFEPIRISTRLWIVPTWHTPSDPGAINIILDPGLAFGTGSHPTTQLCLRWLDANINGSENMLDYGCGSGILAIAALKLGAASAVGVDVDAQAVQASRDNASANEVVARFYLADECPQQQADIVIANILTNPLKLLAPLLAGATRQGGSIVLSGILQAQAEDVMVIYNKWFDLMQPVENDGWVCLSGVKR